MLGAIADALLLSDEERVHLKRLAVVTSGPELCPLATAPVREVQPTVRALLARLDPTPAFVIGAYLDLLAWNSSWECLTGPIGLLDGLEPNLARFTFLHPGARTAFPDWSATADEQASTLRWMSPHCRDDPTFAALVAELQEVPAFAERWSSHQVVEKRRGTKRLRHPVVGEVCVASEVLLLPDEDGQRLITWLPADPASEDAIRQVLVDGSSLRAVN